MKYLKTYKIFESKDGLNDLWMFNINSIIDKFKDCFVDVKDMGINVEVTYDKNDDIILVYLEKRVKVNGFSGYHTTPFEVESILEAINFANSYCSELGLVPDGVNYTYYDEEGESTGSYQSSVESMLRALTKINDTNIGDLLLSYKIK